jgi:Protein of unknown function (DUF3800)
MHFIYIDDSTVRPVNIFSALAIPHRNWNEVFAYLRKWREHLRDVHGIPISFEMHATNFLSGRNTGKRIGHLSRHKRAQIFHKYIEVVEYMHKFDVRTFHVCTTNDNQYQAFERLLNRINRTMQAWDSYAHLICDNGKEHQYTSMVRKMRVHNPIPSNRGEWESGQETKNIPIERILEDPQFKNSERSFFIQTSDFLAYSLLRYELPDATARKRRVHLSFEQLDKVLVRECNPRDPKRKGIIR